MFGWRRPKELDPKEIAERAFERAKRPEKELFPDWSGLSSEQRQEVLEHCRGVAYGGSTLHHAQLCVAVFQALWKRKQSLALDLHLPLLIDLGNVALAAQQPAVCLAARQETVSLATVSGEPSSISMAYQGLALALSECGETEGIELAYEAALAAAHAARDGNTLASPANVLRNLALFLAASGRFAEAEQRFQEALTDAENLGDPRTLARSLAAYGIFLTRQGRQDEGQRLLDRAATLFDPADPEAYHAPRPE